MTEPPRRPSVDQPSHTALGAGTEFDHIRAIWRRLGARAVPAGDDCAIVQVGGERLAISTDLVVEGTHFRPGWLAPHELGWRATAAALSDLGAVAAEPHGVLVSLGVSPEWPEELIADLMEGVGAAAASVGAAVWGGDLVRSERLTVDLVVVGRAARPVRRSGAEAGDRLWVTGALGAPAAALEAWLAGAEPNAAARERFARPVPRIVEGRWLGERGAKAMIDLSDGLVGDAGHLAAASGVACVIQSERVPVHAGALHPRAALVSGEEYELLAALPAAFDAGAAREFEESCGVSLTRIGRIEEGEGVSVLERGVPVSISGGWAQFG